MNTWRVLNPFSRHGMFIKYTWWILLFCSPQFQHALFEYMNIDLYISICSCKLEGQKHTQYKSPCIPCLCTRTPHTCPNSHTHTHTNAQAGISHCVFLWTWRTGRKQQDAVSMMPALTRALTFSSASFLQRLSFFLPAPLSHSPIVCLFSWYTGTHFRILLMHKALPRRAARHEREGRKVR